MNEPRPQVDLMPARLWQVAGFLRLNLTIVKDVDPWAQSLLSHPWRLSNLFTFVHMLLVFLSSAAYFVLVSGARVGAVWLLRRREHIFILSIGLLRGFQKQHITRQVADFIEEYAQQARCKSLVAAVAPNNRAVRWLMIARGGKPLGLSTARLTLSPALSPAAPHRPMRIVQIDRAEAQEARKRWRLYEVEQVAGRAGVDVAVDFFEPFPRRSRYFSLYQEGQEIGFAFARQRGELEIGLFPAKEFWAGPETADLVAALASHVGAVVHHLVLTKTHADALAASAPFSYERHLDQERHLWFKPQESVVDDGI